MNSVFGKHLIPTRKSRSIVLLLVFLLLITTALTAGVVRSIPSAPARPTPSHWVGTWSTSPMPPDLSGISTTGFNNQTLRLIVHTTIGGNAVRLRFSNTFGATPLTIGQVDVADQLLGANIVAGSDHQLTFGGSPAVMIPAGAEAFSDPLPFHVQAQQNLAVSLFLPQATGPTTWHALNWQTSYISQTGNHAADQFATAFTTTTTSTFWLDGVDVTTAPFESAIVTLGDSITEGFNSTVNANHRWPDTLARRLMGQEAVLNEAISGNRVLNNAPCCGTNAVSRVERDVLAQDGARFVILLEGINDIGFSQLSGAETAPQTNVSAAQIIAGMEQIITQVHLKGLKIFGGTLTPFLGAGYYSTAGEAKREAVNQWIRTSGAFDAVIDFDKAVRDPQNPLHILPAFDSGDHLHPNDAGYAAMGNSIDLRLFREEE